MKLGLFVLLCSILCTSPDTLAGEKKAISGKRSHEAKKQKKHLRVTNSGQAAAIVKNRTGGKILKVQPNNRKNGYKVKVIKKDGHIFSVNVDAKSGRVKGK